MWIIRIRSEWINSARINFSHYHFFVLPVRAYFLSDSFQKSWLNALKWSSWRRKLRSSWLVRNRTMRLILRRIGVRRSGLSRAFAERRKTMENRWSDAIGALCEWAFILTIYCSSLTAPISFITLFLSNYDNQLWFLADGSTSNACSRRRKRCPMETTFAISAVRERPNWHVKRYGSEKKLWSLWG